MATVVDKSGASSVSPGTDNKYAAHNRTAADLATAVALTPLYPGEIVTCLDTGKRIRADGPTTNDWVEYVASET